MGKLQSINQGNTHNTRTIKKVAVIMLKRDSSSVTLRIIIAETVSKRPTCKSRVSLAKAASRHSSKPS